MKSPSVIVDINGSNVSDCKEYMEHTELLQRNDLPAQLCTLTFICMNKWRRPFYYSVPARQHLWLSKKWNATETSDHPRGCATGANRAHKDIRGKRDVAQRLFFFPRRTRVIISTTASDALKMFSSSLQLQQIICTFTRNCIDFHHKPTTTENTFNAAARLYNMISGSFYQN